MQEKAALGTTVLPPHGPQSRYPDSPSVSLGLLAVQFFLIYLPRSLLITLAPLLLPLLPLLAFAPTSNSLHSYLHHSNCSKRRSDSCLSTNPQKWPQSDLP